MFGCSKTAYKTKDCNVRPVPAIFLHKPFFFPDKSSSKLHSYKKLTKVALETSLNELFTMGIEQKEKAVDEYIREQQINMT